MSIVSHTVTTSPQSSTRMNAVYWFTDHIGGVTVVNKLVANEFDTNSDALSMYPQIEIQLANDEIYHQFSIAENGENPDINSVHSIQATFDRKLLGLVMTLSNAQIFLGSLLFYQALELRGGANSGQRAIYLGVALEDFQLVETRFNQIMGAETILNADEERVWDDPMEGWE